jgi:hypothetical protein
MSSAQNVTAAAAVMPVTQQRAGKKKTGRGFFEMTASDAVEGGV